MTLPKQYDISGNGEVPLRVDNNNSVFGKGEIRVTFPAISIECLLWIISCIVMGSDWNNSNQFAIFGIPYDDFF